MKKEQFMRTGILSRALVACAALLVAIGCAAVPASAQTAPSPRFAALATVNAVAPCASLTSVDLATDVGEKTSITAASEVAGQHPYCRVTGTIARTIKFEVRLPLSGWTQRFLHTGCGGLCGMIRIDTGGAEGCTPVTDGSVALAATDMGHQGMGDEWGENADQRVDFAWRGNHLTALAAKALIRTFYGQAPRYSYFSGCSDGGREALIEAQRFPQDFDGIAAGAPALNFTIQNSFHHGWLAKSNTGADGKALLSAVDMAPLHAAVMKACDGLDGLVDGQITDPRQCRFDPAVIRCSADYQPGKCLTGEQVTAARAIYEGARSPSGKRLEVGPIMPGSELEWVGVFVPREKSGAIMSTMMALGTINHLLFTPNRTYTIGSFPFTEAMFAELESARQLYNADNPDLAGFAAHGGKLLLWHGWSDPHISPQNTIDYYARVGRRMGAAKRQTFVRMFLLPGMGHCMGGDGPNQFPLLASLMAWVETGNAPDVLIAHRAPAPAVMPPPPAAGQKAAPLVGPDGKPLTPEMLSMLTEMQRRQAELASLGSRSRPIFAYPKLARFLGHGSIDDASNFSAAMPPAINGIADWIGATK